MQQQPLHHSDFKVCAEYYNDQLEVAKHVLRSAQATIAPGTALPINLHQSMRPLYETEIMTLKRNHCTCTDWSQMRFLVPTAQAHYDHSPLLLQRVAQTNFKERIILVISKETIGQQQENKQQQQLLSDLPPGIVSNLFISNSILDLSARIYRNTTISNTHIGADAVIVQCGVMYCHTNKLAELNIQVGAETGGGRTIRLTQQSTMVEVCQQLDRTTTTTTTPRHGKEDTTESSSSTTTMSSLTMNFVGESCTVRDTPTLENVFLYPLAKIEGATAVRHAILFSQSSVQTSSTAEYVILQWKSSVSGNSSISHAFLMEEAHAGPHSFCSNVVLGPDVHVSTGEVHASVIGPNTNAHHQSLVIGMLWHLGRGNVGYGANVGSNHTGRLPDQECVSGEGIFWGLSCVVKYPVDMTCAPYSIVAAGTTLSPQRICMPFSLIVPGPDGNQIMPGWVLSQSPYTIARSEAKYATRRKAIRHDHYTGWKILRAETIDLCVQAREELNRCDTSSKQRIKGVGECILSAKAREAGVEAYTGAIRRFALHGLLRQLEAHPDRVARLECVKQLVQVEQSSGTALGNNVRRSASDVAWPIWPWQMSQEAIWEYQKWLLVQEFGLPKDEISWLCDALKALVELEKLFSDTVYKSKARDDFRGTETIPGYRESHVTADDDPVVNAARLDSSVVEEKVLSILQSMECRSKL